MLRTVFGHYGAVLKCGIGKRSAALVQFADADAAAAKLDAAGWTLHENGKREQDGDELTVNLVADPHRPGLVVVRH